MKYFVIFKKNLFQTLISLILQWDSGNFSWSLSQHLETMSLLTMVVQNDSLYVYLLPSLIINSAFQSIPVWRINYIKFYLRVYGTFICKSSECLKNYFLLSDLIHFIDGGKASLKESMIELGPAVGQSQSWNRARVWRGRVTGAALIFLQANPCGKPNYYWKIDWKLCSQINWSQLELALSVFGKLIKSHWSLSL